MSNCSTAQEAFPQQARALVHDLGSFASPADYETQSRLDHLLGVVDSTYMDWLPLERDAVVDALLALLCETCAHGSLDLVSSASAVSLWSSLDVAKPPEEPVVNIPHVWRHISDKVTWLARPYKSGIANWRRDFKNAVSPDKLRRLDVHAQGILVECFDKRTQGLWVSGRPGTVLPRLPSFPTADDCLADAQYDTQTVAARFYTYSHLLDLFARLYETKGGADAVCARHTALETRKPVARQHFSLLRDQEHALVVRVRAALVQACHIYVGSVQRHAPNPLPPAEHYFRTLLQPLFTVAGAHLVAAERVLALSSTSGNSSPLPGPQMHSLAHALGARHQISDHYCRRYYGTTARAWAARQGARGP
ncbi:hypothetical protein JCM8208_005811 [Rhodotorula glutinis]